MRIRSIYGRCQECDGCMVCQEPREPHYDEWDIDEDLLRDMDDYEEDER